MAVIYRHLKPCGEVFYIGIGKEKSRAYSKHGRSNFWKGIVNKYGYEVQVLKSGLTWREACKLEVILIYYYGRVNIGTGKLCNLTKGGEAIGGYNKQNEIKFIDTRNGKFVKKEYIAKELGIETRGIYKMMSGKSRNFTYYVLEKNYTGEIHEPENKKTTGESTINTLTKEIFTSMTLAGKSIGLSQGVFRKKVTGERPNDTYFVLLSKYDGSVHPPEKIKSREVKIIDTRTGKKVHVDEVALELSITDKTVYRIISGELTNYTYFIREEQYDGEVRIPDKKRADPKSVINIVTKEIFESVVKAAASINLHHDKLRYKLKSKNDTPFMLLLEYEEIYGKVDNQESQSYF